MRKIWRVIDLLKTTEEYFFHKGIENPRLNAELLLGESLNMSRVDLYMSYERPLSVMELDDFREKVKRRALFEPLQYIIGSAEFMGFPFLVNRNVLIPRPETEVLVETVLEMKDEIGNGVILDVGTGSGCIAISLAKLWPQGSYLAMDISPAALQVALQNARLNGVDASLQDIEQEQTTDGSRLFLFEHDIFKGQNIIFQKNITVVISNPPYISKDEMNGLPAEVRQYEPDISLTDNANGLSFYRRLFELASNGYFPKLKYLFLEMSGSQQQQILKLGSKYKFNSIDTRKDLSGTERVLIIRI